MDDASVVVVVIAMIVITIPPFVWLSRRQTSRFNQLAGTMSAMQAELAQATKTDQAEEIGLLVKNMTIEVERAADKSAAEMLELKNVVGTVEKALIEMKSMVVNVDRMVDKIVDDVVEGRGYRRGNADVTSCCRRSCRVAAHDYGRQWCDGQGRERGRRVEAHRRKGKEHG